MSNVSAAPTATGSRTAMPIGGQAIGQVINPPPRLPQLAAAGAVIRAVVLGEEAPGLLRLSSDLGQLTLRSGLRLQPGTVVSLQLRPIGAEVHVLLLADQGRAAERWQPGARTGLSGDPAQRAGQNPGQNRDQNPGQNTPVPAAAPTAAGAAVAASLAAGRWPALEAVMRLLLEGPGRGASGGAPPPRPGRHLAASWHRLFSAYAAGEARSWLGPLPETEEAAGAERELRRDFARLAALAAEPDAEGWRHLGLPLYAEGQLVLRWLRLRGGQGEDEGTDAGTRFQLDLEFSALGPVQLDGLLHEPRFDLVLRSHRPLPEALREDLSAVHREAARLTGLHGRLHFRVETDWQPLPPPAALLAEGSLLV